MKNFWKKTGWTCMTILPLICSLAMQLLVGIMANIIITT